MHSIRALSGVDDICWQVVMEQADPSGAFLHCQRSGEVLVTLERSLTHRGQDLTLALPKKRV